MKPQPPPVKALGRYAIIVVEEVNVGAKTSVYLCNDVVISATQ